MSQPSAAKLCAYCDADATTRDHIPPRSIFPRPWPSDLVTVPSCEDCNGGASLDDEIFRLFLVLREEVEDHHKAFQVLQTAMRGLKRADRPALRRAILESTRDVERFSPGGIYLGQGKEYALPLKRIVDVSNRIARGLYFHHVGERLPDGYEVVSRPAQALDLSSDSASESLRELIALTDPQVFSIAEGAFMYRFGICEDDPGSSFWVFIFFGTFAFVAFTTPVDVP